MNNGERIVSSINGVGKTGQPYTREWNWTSILYHTQKSTPMDKNLNVTIKHSGENMSGKLLNISPEDNFFDNRRKSKKSKNKQMGLHHTNKLLHSKGNNQKSEKADWRTGENSCKPNILGVNF